MYLVLSSCLCISKQLRTETPHTELNQIFNKYHPKIIKIMNCVGEFVCVLMFLSPLPCNGANDSRDLLLLSLDSMDSNKIPNITKRTSIPPFTSCHVFLLYCFFSSVCLCCNKLQISNRLKTPKQKTTSNTQKYQRIKMI